MIYRAKEEDFCSRNITSDERGAALIIALLIMVVLSVLGTMAIMITSTDIKISNNYRQYQNCFYAADGGIELSKCLIQNRDNIQNCTNQAEDEIINDSSFLNDDISDNLIIDDDKYEPDINVDIGLPVDIDIDFNGQAPGNSLSKTNVERFQIDSVARRDGNACSNVETAYRYGRFIIGGMS